MLVLVLAAALLARLAVVEFKRDTFRPRTDAADYDRHALSIAKGDGYPATIKVFFGRGPTAFRAPAFPYFLAGVYKVTGTSSEHRRWTAGLIAGALMGTITVALIALIALELWGRRVALLSASLAAVYPPFIFVGSSLLSEWLFIPFELAAVLAALRHRRSPHRYRWAVAAGTLCGLAALTRSNGFYMVLPVALALWPSGHNWSWRALTAPATAVVCAALTIAPWTIRNAVVMHSFVPISTEEGLALAGTYNESVRADPGRPGVWTLPVGVPPYRDHDPLTGEIAVTRELLDGTFRFIRKHPLYPFTVAYHDTGWLLGFSGEATERFAANALDQDERLAVVSLYSFFPIALLAMAGAFTLKARRAPRFLWLIPVLVFASAVFVAGSNRYRLPADPFFLMLASLALTAAWDRVRPTASPAPAGSHA